MNNDNTIFCVECYTLRDDSLKVIFLSRGVLVDYCVERGIARRDDNFNDLIEVLRLYYIGEKFNDYVVYYGEYPNSITKFNNDSIRNVYSKEVMEYFGFDGDNHIFEFDIYMVNGKRYLNLDDNILANIEYDTKRNLFYTTANVAIDRNGMFSEPKILFPTNDCKNKIFTGEATIKIIKSKANNYLFRASMNMGTTCFYSDVYECIILNRLKSLSPILGSPNSDSLDIYKLQFPWERKYGIIRYAVINSIGGKGIEFYLFENVDGKIVYKNHFMRNAHFQSYSLGYVRIKVPYYKK